MTPNKRRFVTCEESVQVHSESFVGKSLRSFANSSKVIPLRITFNESLANEQSFSVFRFDFVKKNEEEIKLSKYKRKTNSVVWQLFRRMNAISKTGPLVKCRARWQRIDKIALTCFSFCVGWMSLFRSQSIPLFFKKQFHCVSLFPPAFLSQRSCNALQRANSTHCNELWLQSTLHPMNGSTYAIRHSYCAICRNETGFWIWRRFFFGSFIFFVFLYLLRKFSFVWQMNKLQW